MGNFKPNRAGIGAMLRGPELQGLMREKAEKIAAAARSMAPVGKPPEDKHPGMYRDSFEVSSGVTTDVQGNQRAYGRVTNTAPHAAAVEWGNSRSPAQHVLGRAMDFGRE